MNCALQPIPFVVIVATRQWEFSFGSSLFQIFICSLLLQQEKKKRKKGKGKDISSIYVSHVAPSYNLASFPLQF
jgi:hypothetical protein